MLKLLHEKYAVVLFSLVIILIVLVVFFVTFPELINASDTKIVLDVLNLVGFTFAILAFVVSWAESKAQEEKTAAHEKQFKDIADSLSTQYLGQFPFNMKKIIDIVQGGQRKIRIMCDVPGYGVFSQEKEFRQYWNILKEKAEDNIEISIALPKKEVRIEQTRKEFESYGWDEMKKNNGDEIKSLFAANQNKPPILDEISFDDFLDSIEKKYCSLIEEVQVHKYKNIKIIEIDKFPSYFYWVVDGMNAVFTMPKFDGDETEQCFFTSDDRLIKALAVTDAK